MLDIFRILDKAIHMKISQILNQTLSTYNTQKNNKHKRCKLYKC
ncbi:MAG: hypothetical protein SPH02_01850 [Campylobacter sp.]|nr:hypothetical protein [Campylobacter sp.]